MNFNKEMEHERRAFGKREVNINDQWLVINHWEERNSEQTDENKICSTCPLYLTSVFA